jgi:hypothetical protein
MAYLRSPELEAGGDPRIILVTFSKTNLAEDIFLGNFRTQELTLHPAKYSL